MEKGILFFVKEEHFSDQRYLTGFFEESFKLINQQVTDDGKNKVANTLANLFDRFAKTTPYNSAKCQLLIYGAYLLNYVGYRTGNLSPLNRAIIQLEEISAEDLDSLPKNIFYLYHFTKGEAALFSFGLTEDKNQKSYSINNLRQVFESRKHFSFLYNESLKGQLIIGEKNIKNAIVHFCETLAQLSRYTEPFFLLNRLDEKSDEYKWPKALAKQALLDAIRNKTCTSFSPILLIKLRTYLNVALNDANTDLRNLPYIESSLAEIEEAFQKYYAQTGKSAEDLEELEESIDKKDLNLSPYRSFVIDNGLGLNEHGLYCLCKNGIEDNLTIRSDHKHTKVTWAKQFEIILNHLLFDFDSARRAFFRAFNKDQDDLYNQNQFVNEGVLFSQQETDLIQSFKTCFSILDKIATACNLAWGVTNEKVHFHTYFKRRDVRQNIDNLPNNLFAIALFSISQDIDTQSPYAAFSEYKDWRNAAEHQNLYLISDEADVSELKKNYPDVEYFIRKAEFKEKTIYLLHLSRSAIFSFTWAIRKQTIQFEEEE